MIIKASSFRAASDGSSQSSCLGKARVRTGKEGVPHGLSLSLDGPFFCCAKGGDYYFGITTVRALPFSSTRTAVRKAVAAGMGQGGDTGRS